MVNFKYYVVADRPITVTSPPQNSMAYSITSVKEQICEQASYTLYHINRAKLFTENSAVARLRDLALAVPPAYVNTEIGLRAVG